MGASTRLASSGRSWPGLLFIPARRKLSRGTTDDSLRSLSQFRILRGDCTCKLSPSLAAPMFPPKPQQGQYHQRGGNCQAISHRKEHRTDPVTRRHSLGGALSGFRLGHRRLNIQVVKTRLNAPAGARPLLLHHVGSGVPDICMQLATSRSWAFCRGSGASAEPR